MTIPASAIRLAYLWPCNLAHAAFTLSRSYGKKISVDELALRFESECVNHPLLHELGERPEKGFSNANQGARLAEKLLREEHDACAEL